MAAQLRRWRERVAGIPARMLMRRISARIPGADYDGIALTVIDPVYEPDAERFFARTKEALSIAWKHSPEAYRALRRDVQRIVLSTRGPSDPIYHTFQLAVIVPPQVALRTNITTYASWLLFASGLSRDIHDAKSRGNALLAALPEEERRRTESELAETVESHRPALTTLEDKQ